MSVELVPSKRIIPNYQLLILVYQTKLARYLEDLALVVDHIVASHRSRPGPTVLGDRPARTVRTPSLRQILLGSRRVLLHRGGRRGRFFCGGRVRCSSRGPDLKARSRAESFFQDFTQLLEVSRILCHPDVEALLLGVDEQQHLAVEALDPRLAVDRSRERLPAALELAHDPVPLRGEIHIALPPVIGVFFRDRSFVGRRVRLLRILRGLSLHWWLLTHDICGGP